jgi:hypothetical protein
MSATAAPFGCRAVFHPSGTVRQKTLSGFTSIPSAAVYKGDLIKLTGDGSIAAIITANDAAIGIFRGCEYTAADGTPVISPYWPASLSGVTNIKWHYTPFDPLLECEIQSSGSIAVTAIGDSADMVMAAGSAYTGVSGSSINSTLKGAGAVGNFRIIGLGQQADNAWGDSYTIVRVQIAKNQILTEVNSI